MSEDLKRKARIEVAKKRAERFMKKLPEEKKERSYQEGVSLGLELSLVMLRSEIPLKQIRDLLYEVGGFFQVARLKEKEELLQARTTGLAEGVRLAEALVNGVYYKEKGYF